MSLEEASLVYSPTYHDLVEITIKHEKVHWFEHEAKLINDVEQWKNGTITDAEKNLLKNILRLFTESDVAVGSSYYDKLIPRIRNNEARSMLGCFAARECFDEATEVLTTEGWKLFEDVDLDDRFAQYNHKTGALSFTKAERLIAEDYVGPMHYYQGKVTDLCITPNHELILINPHTDKVTKRRSEEGVWGRNFKIPVAGVVPGTTSEAILALDRLLVAAQADGTLKGLAPWCLENRPNERRCVFNLKKSHKIERLKKLLEDASRYWDLQVLPERFSKQGNSVLSFIVPEHIDLRSVKSMSWFNLNDVLSDRARNIVEELPYWDASSNSCGADTSFTYYNSNKSAVDMVSALAVLCGYRAIVGINRSADDWEPKAIADNTVETSSIKTCYAISFVETDTAVLPYREELNYDGKIYCLTVPDGNVVVRRNGRVAITGNSIHQRGYALLNDTLGLGKDFYWEFLDYHEMKNKHEFILEGDAATPREFALYLAKQCLVEGVMLFASFAILLNFERVGKLPGMCDIVRWSQVDECYSDDTEILTSDGWKLFEELVDSDRVAQYHGDTAGVNFVHPDRIVSYDDVPTLIHLESSNGVDLLVTPNHDIVWKYKPTGQINKTKANAFSPHHRRQIPVAGVKLGGIRTTLSPEERLLIVFQADGVMPVGRYRNGNNCGYRRVQINLKKERKKERLRMLLRQTSWSWSEKEGSRPGFTTFKVDFPSSFKLDKDFTWLDLESASVEYLKEFVDEVGHWDGSWCRDGYNIFTTTKGDAAHMVQSAAALCGFKTKLVVVEDDRSENFSDVYRLFINMDVDQVGTGTTTKTEVPYGRKVWCVTVPTGMIVVRRNGKVCVSGNSLHLEGNTALFRHYLNEHPEIVDDSFKREIYEYARRTAALEDAFIDKAFELGGVDDLDPEDVKQYVRYMTDYRLNQLGLKKNWDIGENPLSWIDYIMGKAHANFFERSVHEYAKGNLDGEFTGGYGPYEKLDGNKVDVVE